VDGSRSMAVGDGRKEALVRELADFLLGSARRSGERASLHGLGDAPREALDASGLSFEASRPSVLHEVARWGHLARRGAVHVLVSDFLTGEPAAPVVRALAARASRLVLIRVLGPWEAAPTVGETCTLRDAETGAERTLRITSEAAARYRSR